MASRGNGVSGKSGEACMPAFCHARRRRTASGWKSAMNNQRAISSAAPRWRAWRQSVARRRRRRRHDQRGDKPLLCVVCICDGGRAWRGAKEEISSNVLSERKTVAYERREKRRCDANAIDDVPVRCGERRINIMPMFACDDTCIFAVPGDSASLTVVLLYHYDSRHLLQQSLCEKR